MEAFVQLWFSTLDAKNGYHQILINVALRDYPCFITPWGRYRFKRATMGMTSSGDKFNFEVDVAMGGIQNTAKVVDDIMCSTVSFEQHLVLEILQAARKHGITVSPSKFYFGEPDVKFIGYIVGRDGIKAEPAKLKAIT